jgi:D-amino-acid dehydrogenase
MRLAEQPLARIGIVGSGIVGLATACELCRRGHVVEILDPLGPGAAASHGNAALIAVTQNLPLARPDIRRELPRLLLDREGPLVVRPGHLPRLLPWSLDFLRASAAARVAPTARALAGLLNGAMPAWTDLLGHYGEASRLVRRGSLYVYIDPARLAAAQADAALRRSFGARIEPIPAEEIRQMEPALAGRFAGALLDVDAGFVTDPGGLCTALAARFVEAGGKLARDKVASINPGASGGVLLATDAGSHTFERVVIATGVDAGTLARPLGCRVRVESERGYHVDLPGAASLLRGPVGFGDRKFVLTPLSQRLRVAGTAEFAGRDALPDPRRAAILLTQARRLLPDLPETGGTTWSGHRPSTPDSRPVIGLSPRSPHVLFAFGHGHLGLTLAAVTADRVARLIAGEAAPDLAAFAPDRR